MSFIKSDFTWHFFSIFFEIILRILVKRWLILFQSYCVICFLFNDFFYNFLLTTHCVSGNYCSFYIN